MAVVDIVPLSERGVGALSKMMVSGELWSVVLVLNLLFALV